MSSDMETQPVNNPGEQPTQRYPQQHEQPTQVQPRTRRPIEDVPRNLRPWLWVAAGVLFALGVVLFFTVRSTTTDWCLAMLAIGSVLVWFGLYKDNACAAYSGLLLLAGAVGLLLILASTGYGAPQNDPSPTSTYVPTITSPARPASPLTVQTNSGEDVRTEEPTPTTQPPVTTTTKPPRTTTTEPTPTTTVKPTETTKPPTTTKEKPFTTEPTPPAQNNQIPTQDPDSVNSGNPGQPG